MAGAQVAVLGCGRWGRHLVRHFAAAGALRAVCDTSAAARELAHTLAPNVALSDDPQSIFRDPEIDGIVVATPAATHVSLCRAALIAGQDVFCEKPLSLELATARELAAEAERRGRLLMVGHVLEYHPAVRKLGSLISNGALGELRYLYSNRLNLGTVRTEENILWSFAPHDVAVILRLAGGRLPLQVSAGGGAWLRPEIADVTVTQLRFRSGVSAHIFVSWLNPFKEQKLVVVGSKRMASFDDVKKRLILYDQRVELVDGEPISVRNEGEVLGYDDEEPLAIECRAFLEAMRTRKPPLTDASSALDVLSVLDAAERSLQQNGQPVEPEKR